jgi:probable O-glycosylation ligase (exosortase A-associated)
MKGLIFTYLLTVIGSVGCFLNPFIGLAVYVCFAIVRPEHMWDWVLSDGRTSRVVGLALLASWAMHGFGRWRFGRAASVVGCMLGYWGWMILCAVMAEDQAKAWVQVESFSKIFLPFLVGITTITTLREVKILVWIILLSLGYVAFEMNLSYYAGFNRLAEDGFGGLDNNSFAIGLVAGVGLAFFLGMGERAWWKKGTALVLAALMGHAILLSFSRGAMLAMGLTGVMAFALIPKRPGHYVVLALAVALAIRLAGPEVRKRFFSSFEQSATGQREASAQSRIDLWRDAGDVAITHPLFGVGPDNWGVHAPEYGWPRGKEAHSLWVQNAAEVGFPGLILLLSYYVVCIVKLWPLARDQIPVDDPWMPDAARMIVAALFGFVIAAQFVTIKYLEVPYYIVLAGAVLLKRLPAPRSSWSHGPRAAFRRLPMVRRRAAGADRVKQPR